jgi:hypothetical protein
MGSYKGADNLQHAACGVCKRDESGVGGVREKEGKMEKERK